MRTLAGEPPVAIDQLISSLSEEVTRRRQPLFGALDAVLAAAGGALVVAGAHHNVADVQVTLEHVALLAAIVDVARVRGARLHLEHAGHAVGAAVDEEAAHLDALDAGLHPLALVGAQGERAVRLVGAPAAPDLVLASSHGLDARQEASPHGARRLDGPGQAQQHVGAIHGAAQRLDGLLVTRVEQSPEAVVLGGREAAGDVHVGDLGEGQLVILLMHLRHSLLVGGRELLESGDAGPDS